MTGPGLLEAIDAGVDELGLELPTGGAERLARLVVEVVRWNARMNLTAIREPLAMVPAHLLDSLAVHPYLEGATVLDVGTGAGFPGLPLAIAEPERHFTMLDSNGRKIEFVRHIIATFEIPNATAVKARAEHYAPDERFGTVLTRAFAAIPEMIELAGHLVSDNGVLLALKGKYPQDELRQLADRHDLSDLWDYNVTELTVPGLTSHARHLVALRRRAE